MCFFRGWYQECYLTFLTVTAPSASLPVMSGTVDILEGRAATRETLMGLRVRVNLLKLHKAKCRVMHLARGSPKHKYRLDNEWIKSSPGRGLGLLDGGKTQQKLAECAFSPESQLYYGVH